jgi:hypothetical protein
VICLHPFVSDGTLASSSTPARRRFRVVWRDRRLLQKLFNTTLQRIWPLTTGRKLIIDADGLEFIGHRQLGLLERYAR